MKMLTTLRAATLATLAGAAISLPTLALASDYNNTSYYDPGQKCRSQENDAQLIGGLLGAVVGGVAGSQVSGNGARTEGSVIGAVVGGLAGAAIGDESVDCDKKRRQRYDNTYYNGQTYGRTRPVVYDRTVTTRRVYQPARRTYGYNGYRNRGYRNNGYRDNGYRNNGYNNGYRTTNYSYGHERYDGNRAQLRDVRRRLHNLRDENIRLENQLRYSHNYRLERRRDWVCDEIIRLEKKERRYERRVYGEVFQFFLKII